MSYVFSANGDFRTIWGDDCIILDILKGTSYSNIYYNVLLWNDITQDYYETSVRDSGIAFWHGYRESSPTQNKQQKLFQRLGTAYRVGANLTSVISDMQDELPSASRQCLWLAVRIIEDDYIPTLRTKMKQLKSDTPTQTPD